ncbi:MAG: BREX system P-loop protein BrxC, partial [Desulfotignum sp.]|nr:BREX system P-loop protein BrxC [Desulfotignum sp.]
DMVLEAAENALQRLYPQFAMADHSGWAKVYEKARTGAPDALKAVGDDGDPSKNPVCKAILGYIAGGKNGADIRKYFESPPYGWSRDAVDGGLQVLLVAGMVRAQDTHGKPLSAKDRASKDLDRKSIGKILFKVESTTVTTAQRIQIRKLFQKAELKANPGEEHLTAPHFLEKMLALAARAGGDPPRPALPDIAFLHEIRLAAGNEQLLALYNQREKLGQCIQTWTELAERIDTRIKNWERLKHLAMHVQEMDEAAAYVSQIKNIETQRQLLTEPDLIPPLIKHLTQLLRDALNLVKSNWDREWQSGESRLKEDLNWQQLEPEQRYALRSPHGLVEAARPAIEVDTTDAVLQTVAHTSLSALKDRIAAMPGRYDQVLLKAAQLLEPELQKVNLPARTLKTQADVDAWLDQTRKLLMEKLSQGPILV